MEICSASGEDDVVGAGVGWKDVVWNVAEAEFRPMPYGKAKLEVCDCIACLIALF